MNVWTLVISIKVQLLMKFLEALAQPVYRSAS